jgi:hypothetical protein
MARVAGDPAENSLRGPILAGEMKFLDSGEGSGHSHSAFGLLELNEDVFVAQLVWNLVVVGQ